MSDEPYDGMTCDDCGRGFDEVIDFLVATPIWNYVMAGERETTYTIRPGLFPDAGAAGEVYPRVEGAGGVVCLVCFDKRARECGINYRESLIVFGIDCWMGYDRDVRMPLTPPNAEHDWEPRP